MEFRKSGVFSPCANMDSVSMIKCLQALCSKYPSIKFNSVVTDKKNCGFKVFFTEIEEYVVLEKNRLSSEERPVWIYPLTTFLIILNVDNKKSPLFERDLRDAIGRKFGRVIGVLKTGSSNQTKHWRIEVDIPEFKGLEVFQNEDFSDIMVEMRGRNEPVTLKFYCRQCDMVGHFQHDCFARDEENPEGSNVKAEETSINAEQNKDNSTVQASSSSDQNSESPRKNVSNFSLESTERFAEKIGKEEVMSKNVQDNNTTENTERSISYNLLMENDIKKETTESTEGIGAKGSVKSGNKNSEIQEKYTNLKNESTGSANNLQIFSSDDDDDIEVIACTNNSSSNKSPLSAVNGGGRNVEEESRSSPEARDTNFSFTSLPGTSGSPHAFPFTATLAASKTPKGAEVTTALSERLQDCIDQVCETAGVLDRKKLDAFLIHVKKKSNPIRVALNYTANTKGLKEQLQGILHMYYNTPQTGTKEDIQFIKWLNGLVERYDGSIPKKRKRSGKTDDEPSVKR